MKRRIPFGFSRILKTFSLSMAGNIKPILTKTCGQQNNFFQNLKASLWNIFNSSHQEKKSTNISTKLQWTITKANWVSVRLRHSSNHDASYFLSAIIFFLMPQVIQSNLQVNAIISSVNCMPTWAFFKQNWHLLRVNSLNNSLFHRCLLLRRIL